MFNGPPKPAESNFVEVINKLQNPALEIMNKNNQSFEQMAQSFAITTALIIRNINNISPEEALKTAILHYIEGIKTFPPEFSK